MKRGFAFFVLLLAFSSVEAFCATPVPHGQNFFRPVASGAPVVSEDPAALAPFGLGPFADGGETLRLRVAFPGYDAPVDIYLGIQVSKDPSNIFLLDGDGGLHHISEGLVPWKASVQGPVNEPLFPDIDMSALPRDLYTFYAMVTPSQNHLRSATSTRAGAEGDFFFYFYESIISNHDLGGYLTIYYTFAPYCPVRGSADAYFYVDSDGWVDGIASTVKLTDHAAFMFVSGTCGACTLDGVMHFDVYGAMVNYGGQRKIHFLIEYDAPQYTLTCPGLGEQDVSFDTQRDEFETPVEDAYFVGFEGRALQYLLRVTRNRLR